MRFGNRLLWGKMASELVPLDRRPGLRSVKSNSPIAIQALNSHCELDTVFGCCLLVLNAT